MSTSTRRVLQNGASGRGRQSGVATLIVVLVLFFVISMVAAYTNRNLIFEQRTSSNQYRSTQALEAAEAGLEWVTATLNMGRVDDSCVATTDTTKEALRDRLLVINSSGRIQPRSGPSGEELTAMCVFSGSGWTCACPTSGTASVTPPTGPGIWPAFRVRFQNVAGASATPTVPRQPGVIRAEVVGCTRADLSGTEPCLQFGSALGAVGEGRAVVTSLLALTGSTSSPPQAALMVRHEVHVTGGGISAVNSIAGGSGITIHAGHSVIGTNQLIGQPGSPGGDSTLIQNDSTLALPQIGGTSPITTSDRMFGAVFNLRPDTFRQQPAALVLTCDPCDGGAVRAAASQNPWRPLWLPGGLSVSDSNDIGSPTFPVLMVVNGDLTVSPGATPTIYGVVYVRTPLTSPHNGEWRTSGAGTIQGATIAEHNLEGNGTTMFVFDPSVMNLIRSRTGSFVRVPGSWKDFE